MLASSALRTLAHPEVRDQRGTTDLDLCAAMPDARGRGPDDTQLLQVRRHFLVLLRTFVAHCDSLDDVPLDDVEEFAAVTDDDVAVVQHVNQCDVRNDVNEW